MCNNIELSKFRIEFSLLVMIDVYMLYLLVKFYV